jgi:hypothetical protein
MVRALDDSRVDGEFSVFFSQIGLLSVLSEPCGSCKAAPCPISGARAFSALAGRAAWSAAIAQLVEHVIRNDGVGGSSPSCGTGSRTSYDGFGTPRDAFRLTSRAVETKQIPSSVTCRLLVPGHEPLPTNLEGRSSNLFGLAIDFNDLARSLSFSWHHLGTEEDYLSEPNKEADPVEKSFGLNPC